MPISALCLTMAGVKVRKGRLFIAGAGLLLLLGLAGMVAVALERPPGWLVAPPDGGTVTVMSGLTSDGRPIEVRVESGRLGFIRSSFRRVATDRIWAHSGRLYLGRSLQEHEFLWRVTATIDDTTVPVPPQAFMDLLQFRLDRIESTEGRFFIHFKGADAGEAYDGFIEFEGDAVVRRDIWYGEFPDHRESMTFRAERVTKITSTLP